LFDEPAGFGPLFRFVGVSQGRRGGDATEIATITPRRRSFPFDAAASDHDGQAD
jgi:hypothetical protein